MPVSTRFREMRARLTELRKHMLPSQFSPTGDYSDSQLDRARGYRVLVHAEIESYLEDVAREAVTNAIRAWKSDRKPSMIIVSFLAAYHSGWDADNERGNADIIELAKARSRARDTVDEAINIAQNQYITLVRNNHGVKENNFKRLVLPLGVDFEKIDKTWLANLDSFGANRGETAHKTKRASSQINPEDECNAVKMLLKGLRELDEIILKVQSL